MGNRRGIASGARGEGDEDFAIFEGEDSDEAPEESINALQRAGLQDMRPAQEEEAFFAAEPRRD